MIRLPFPHKALWPNGRAHWAVKSREVKKHRQWAHDATLAAIGTVLPFRWDGHPVRLKYIVTPKTAHAIDRDNCIAAMKAYQDGIADALGVDDSYFATPEIEFAEPEKPGRVEVVL